MLNPNGTYLIIKLLAKRALRALVILFPSVIPSAFVISALVYPKFFVARNDTIDLTNSELSKTEEKSLSNSSFSFAL